MGDGGSVGRIERLEALKLLLGEREYTTAGDLAADLGISLRTLHRDLATLRDLGVPVGGVAGRGGGVFLERGWSLGRVHLNEREAMALLLSLAIAAQVESPLLLDDLRSIERKIAQAFAPSQASRIKHLRRRVLVGGPASPAVVASQRPVRPPVTRILFEGFTEQRVMGIDYVDQAGATSSRVVEPHYLYFAAPVWYVLAWDRQKVDVRSFRIDRIVRVHLERTTFRLRPSSGFVDAAELEVRSL